MKINFDSFLNESSTMNIDSIKFSDDYNSVIEDARSKIANKIANKICGRIVTFYTKTIYSETLKVEMLTSQSAIKYVDDVIIDPNFRDNPMFFDHFFLIKSGKKYYSFSPNNEFFFIDTFIEDFNKNYIGKQISFWGNQAISNGIGNLDKLRYGIPVKIEIEENAYHQMDAIRIYMNDGEKYWISHKKPIKMKSFNVDDPFGEDT